jgi:hypothetical protein
MLDAIFIIIHVIVGLSLFVFFDFNMGVFVAYMIAITIESRRSYLEWHRMSKEINEMLDRFEGEVSHE